MGKQWLNLLAPALLLTGGTFSALAAENAKAETLLADDELAAINRTLTARLSKSLVMVNYYFKADDSGQTPDTHFRYKCPNCNNYHDDGGNDLIANEQPMRVPGYLITPNEIISSDLQVNPEWIKKIEVEYLDQKAQAELVGDCPARQCVKLKLTAPLPETAPLTFTPDAPGQRFIFARSEEGNIPQARTKPYGNNQIFRDLLTGKEWLSTPANSLLTNADGKVITLFMIPQIPLNEKITGSPAKWKFRSAAEIAAERKQVAEQITSNCYPVKIRLAQPPAVKIIKRDSEQEENDSNIEHAIGIKLKNGLFLIRAKLTPQHTARLESVSITVGNRSIPADFIGSLKYYGGLVVKPQQEIPGSGIELCTATPSQLESERTWLIDFMGNDERLEVKTIPCRINGFRELMRGVPVPDVSRSSANGWVFTSDLKLLAMPMVNRLKDDKYESDKKIPSALLASMIQDKSGYDPFNVPLDNKQRNRIAWLGVICQQFDKKLAEANRVASYLSDGDTGLMISDVYPGSPAEKLKLKAGDILLSVTPEKSGRAVKLVGYKFEDITLEESFPWDRYDQIPETYYDRIPYPWYSQQSKLNNMLTSLGIGSKATLVVIADGKPSTREFTIEAAPDRFETTEKVNNQELGITVCKPTFEVRQYFHLNADAPGILVSKVRPGSPASTAGIKPYELLLSMNNQPLKSLSDFKPAPDAEMSLTVSRMGENRIVKLKPGPVPVGPRIGTAQ